MRVILIVAAVAAFIALPQIGIQPTRNCDTVLPPSDANAPASILSAADFAISRPNTAPKLIIIVICIPVIGMVSEPGICANPAAIAEAATVAP